MLEKTAKFKHYIWQRSEVSRRVKPGKVFVFPKESSPPPPAKKTKQPKKTKPQQNNKEQKQEAVIYTQTHFAVTNEKY